MRSRLTLTAAAMTAVAMTVAGCGSEDTAPDGDAIRITGSSTVEPITSYMANRYDFNLSLIHI